MDVLDPDNMFPPPLQRLFVFMRCFSGSSRKWPIFLLLLGDIGGSLLDLGILQQWAIHHPRSMSFGVQTTGFPESLRNDASFYEAFALAGLETETA